MEVCTNVIEDECAEISVNTEVVEPRGTFAENEQRKMTSFETLVHTALALEEDPRDEHSYAYSDKKVFQESMDKDHCYYSGSKLDSHRKIQSLSDENLSIPPRKNDFIDKNFLLPHYRSNDSALDVTGFDTISDKCLSSENIHVKTVDVFTENCILPGVSDPDLSRMTIKSQTSFSLPNSPPSSEISVIDHSYSYIMSEQKVSEQNRMSLLKDHAYNNFSKINSHEKPKVLLDHSYGNGKRRDSLPSNVGVKRGRSNDDLSLLGSYSFKRKDFTKSPFLDHSYQSVQLRNEQTQTIKRQSSKRNKSVVKESVVKTDKCMQRHGNEIDSKEIEISSSPKTYIVKRALLPNRLLMDHTYEEITDTTVDMPTGFVTKVQAVVETELAQMFDEIRTDKSDHSYVIKNCESTNIDSSSEELSDSGTESLNEEEEENLNIPVNKRVQSHVDKEHKQVQPHTDKEHSRVQPHMDKEHKEHPYFKRTKKIT
ncbi:uncharacterized protein LOC123557711 [Mercenaria mercenaria]|uniref:uncharacterized protein LOC123557711 n=1 Tax=Mercenaria mercenaria TaxID=6596 RepID=UPI00234F2084|nr:uncharacterized protein LOC123557711 [Mercenaria mercenaria]XP_045205282.2 uncharacterized protein LOC123557711 [Mercenaria mercenaria]